MERKAFQNGGLLRGQGGCRMKKIKTKIGDKIVDLDISQFVVDMKGQRFELLRHDREGCTILFEDQEITIDDIFVLEAGKYRVEIKGYTIDVEVEDPVTAALSDQSSSGEIKSPMAGQISQVLVKEGQLVKAGENLIVISAMKMENQITSPVDGIVKIIKVKNNDTISAGKLLAIIEPSS